MFKTKGHAQGYAKEDLKLLQEYIKNLDNDIKDVAAKASQYKRLELEEMESNEYLAEVPPRDFYDMFTQLIRDLKACKKTLHVMERKVDRVMNQSKPKYKVLDWVLLIPLFEKFGWVNNGQISAGEGSTVREGSRQHSEVRVRW